MKCATNRSEEMDVVETERRRRCSERHSEHRLVVTVALSAGRQCVLAASDGRCRRPQAAVSLLWTDHSALSAAQPSSPAAAAAERAVGQTPR